MRPSPEEGVSVLRLITRLNIGGPARQALLLSKGLAPQYQTTLAAGTPLAHEGELVDPDVHVHRVPLVREPSPSRDVAALQAVRALVQQTKPAVLHSHMAKAGAIGRLAVLSTRSPVRTVHTFHGHVLEGYFSKRVQRAFVQAERVLAHRTDVLVAVSEHVRDDLLALGIGRPHQYRVIPLGLDLDEHLAAGPGRGRLRQALGVSFNVPLIGIVGRLAPIKDHATALEALRRVPDAHLAVLGDGELRPHVEAQAERLGLRARVHFTGWWTDIPGAMVDLDVALLTSRNEGTPVALIEAHACALPAVATAVGGVAAVVRHGETGLLAPAGEPDALAAHLRTILDDAVMRRRMGEAARASVRERFSHHRLLHDIDLLYRELLDLKP